MSILITGANGYLGGRLAHYFATETAHKVYEYSRNEKPQTPQNLSAIFHLAGPNAETCQTNPEGSIKVRQDLALEALKLAADFRAKSFFYFSSVHVYGATEGRVNETHTCRPPHAYGRSHLAAEEILLKQKSIPVNILRFSNIIGAPHSVDIKGWGLLVNDLCRQVILNKKLVLRSNPLVERDFIGITSVLKVIAHLLDKSSLLPTDIYNVSSGHNTTLQLMTKLIASTANTLGHKVTSEFLTTPTPAPAPIFSNEKLVQKIGNFTSSLEKEIKETLQFCILNKASLHV